MSAWLNVRFKADPVPKHELFRTEEAAIEALGKALTKHREKKHVVTETWVGPKLRHEIFDENGSPLAVYWLSETGATSHPDDPE